MQKFLASTIKEILLLRRDKAGLTLLFVMPMLLILIMALLQDSSFKTLAGDPIPVLFVDLDKDTLGSSIKQGISQSKSFKLVESIDGKPLTAIELQQQVNEGNFQIGIVVPSEATKLLKKNSKIFVKQNLQALGLDSISDEMQVDSIVIQLFFDPVIVHSFKLSVLNAIDKYISKIETKFVSRIFVAELSKNMPLSIQQLPDQKNIVYFKELPTGSESMNKIPTAVQHNVTAYIIFAIFFIVIPMAGNMIKERDDGCVARLKLMPVSYLTILSGKIFSYLVICFVQFFLMILVGKFILPWFGLSAFEIGSSYFSIFMGVFFIAAAACSFGATIGTIATTVQQGSSFGAISVVILAAIGGIWVPTYIMADVMKIFSNFSPLNWSLTILYDIFVREKDWRLFYPECIKLLSFSLVCISIAFIYNKNKKLA